MRHRSERVRALIADDVIPRTPSGGIALCHDHQRMTMHYKGFLNYLCRRVRWEAVDSDWASRLIPPCPKCGGNDHYYITTRKSFHCKGCGKYFSQNYGSRYKYNKLPIEKIEQMANEILAGASCLSVAKKHGVQVKSVYKIRDRARD